MMMHGNERIYRGIEKLVDYGMNKGLLEAEDRTFMINRYLELFGLHE